MKLTVIYKNGNKLVQMVNYVHYEADSIKFTVKQNPSPVFSGIVKIPLCNIEKFEIEEK